MTTAELEALGADEEREEYRLYELWERLILDNEAIDGGDATEAMTRGQLLLARLGTFHSQVNNGGIEQFFWNCPETIFGVLDDLELLGAQPLVETYSRAVEALVGKGDHWLTLKKRWDAGGDRPDFTTFIESRELLDVDWYDSQFYGKWDGEGGQLERGLGDEIARLAVAYVGTHPAEFIR